jgi:Tol biopolymer transport system component
MKPGSVEEHLTIKPPVQGTFAWEKNTLIFTPDESWPSGETVTVQLTSGSQADGLLPLALLGSQEWSFTIGRPLIAYLWPAAGVANIYTLDPLEGEVSQLTSKPFGVLDFDVNADGTIIYYSARNVSGGSDLFALDRLSRSPQDDPSPLLVCPDAFCRSPKISPNGELLAYERNPLPGGSESLYPQVWIRSLPGSTSSTDTLAGDPNHPARLPEWSAAGLLAFYDITEHAYIFLDPITQESISYPNDTGEAGSWSPDSNAFVAPEIRFTPVENSQETDPANVLAPSNLHRFELPTETSLDLSGSLDLEDTSPVYAPNGQLLAFARKSLDPTLWTPGRQLWVMRPDGEEARQLTSAPYFNHSNFAWSPDSSQIAYLRFNQDNPTAPPEIWLINMETSNTIQLVIGGYAQQWIP